jgi:ribonuclease P protein component
MPTPTQRSVNSPVAYIAASPVQGRARLRKHADYQRVYKSSRKHFSASMAYFFSLRTMQNNVPTGPRVGLTAGKVLGNAVERNRIKRRMREAVRLHITLVCADVDVILHPRKCVLTIEFDRLESEVERIFTTVQKSLDDKTQGAPAQGIV